jgi:predicted nucleotidyltransferase
VELATRAGVTQSVISGAHGVQSLRVFGSVARGEGRPDSEVDLLADLPSGLSLFGLGRARGRPGSHSRQPG